MVGQHPSFLALLKKLERIAAFEEPVLVLGESGVGKEAVAQAVYLLGERRGKPFVPVSCPQYQDGNLSASELFGHRRGSFTGAVSDRKGAFATAHRGVIFLDEIGDLPLTAQAMLLRALASGEFQPLGSDVKEKVDVRVVAATNRPLNELTLADEFRHDLFFRLRYFQLEVPALRDRGDDWRLLADYYLSRLRAKYGKSKTFSPEALHLLAAHLWPGNVRELIGVVTTGYAISTGNRIEPEDITGLLRAPGESGTEEAYALARRIASGDLSFWEDLHKPFLNRDLNRAQVRNVIRLTLADCGGSYRRLLSRFGLAEAEYQKFMDFLRHHELKP